MEKSFIFDSIANDRQYVAQNFADYYKAFFDSGVISLDTNLQVIQGVNTFDVILKTGKAVIEGRYYENTSDETLSVATTATTRVDRLVIRCDTQSANRYIKAFIVQGTTTQPPALTRTSSVYEISLAKISVSTTALTIVDERADNSVCGVSGVALRTTTYTSGSAAYSESLAGSATVTKYISIPYNANCGEILIHNATSQSAGLFIKFSKDNLKTIGIGTGSSYGIATIKGNNGNVSSNPSNSLTYAPAGHDYIEIQDVYIDNSSRIVITFKNTTGSSWGINCKLNYEVWER